MSSTCHGDGIKDCQRLCGISPDPFSMFLVVSESLGKVCVRLSRAGFGGGKLVDA